MVVPMGFKRSRALWENSQSKGVFSAAVSPSFWRAVLYELQPVRYSELRGTKARALLFLKQVKNLLLWVAHRLPGHLRSFQRFLRQRTLREYGIVAAVLFYYAAVRWIHHHLEAGPLLLITTALVLIFTLGLSDEEQTGLSAYSVFNKGFQRLMGSVDEQALLQQHVGGAAALVVPPQQEPGPRQPPANLRDERNDEEPPPLPRAGRRPAKKNRNRNQQQRRELQRQRQAAAALGFGGANEGEAMNRLMDE